MFRFQVILLSNACRTHSVPTNKLRYNQTVWLYPHRLFHIRCTKHHDTTLHQHMSHYQPLHHHQHAMCQATVLHCTVSLLMNHTDVWQTLLPCNCVWRRAELCLQNSAGRYDQQSVWRNENWRFLTLLNLERTNPGRQVTREIKFCRLSVGSQFGTCCMPLIWCLEFWGNF